MATKERIFGSKIYCAQEDSKRKRIFVNMNPKCDGLNYANCAIGQWKNEIMEDLRQKIKKPFLGFFGGTREVVILGPEPLYQMDLVISLIRALRREGFGRRIVVETGGDVERFDHLWLRGSTTYTYQNNMLVDLEVTHPSHPNGIAKELKNAGLNRIVISIEHTMTNEEYSTWEAKRFARECLVAGLDTYVNLIGEPLQEGETKKGFIRNNFSEWVWEKGKTIRLQRSHLMITDSVLSSCSQQKNIENSSKK